MKITILKVLRPSVRLLHFWTKWNLSKLNKTLLHQGLIKPCKESTRNQIMMKNWIKSIGNLKCNSIKLTVKSQMILNKSWTQMARMNYQIMRQGRIHLRRKLEGAFQTTHLTKRKIKKNQTSFGHRKSATGTVALVNSEPDLSDYLHSYFKINSL